MSSFTSSSAAPDPAEPRTWLHLGSLTAHGTMGHLMSSFSTCGPGRYRCSRKRSIPASPVVRSRVPGKGPVLRFLSSDCLSALTLVRSNIASTDRSQPVAQTPIRVRTLKRDREPLVEGILFRPRAIVLPV